MKRSNPMFSDVSLSFREYVMHEPLPIGRIQEAIFDFLRGREDVVMFGAQAVNAYVAENRMTQDVDIMSTRAPEIAEELRHYLNEKFHIAVRVRNVRDGLGYRVYQLQKPENRHLADVRPVSSFPPSQRIDGVLVPLPEEVIANKVTAYVRRKEKPKGGTDLRDIRSMLLQYPNLKTLDGPVAERLRENEADETAFSQWREFVEKELESEDDDDEFL